MNPVKADLKGGELWLLVAVDRVAEGAWLFFLIVPLIGKPLNTFPWLLKPCAKCGPVNPTDRNCLSGEPWFPLASGIVTRMGRDSTAAR